MIGKRWPRVKRQLRKPWVLVWGGVILTALLAFSHLTSAYHVEVGGRQLGSREVSSRVV